MSRSSLIPRRALATIAVLGMLAASVVLTGSVAGEGAPFDVVPGYPLEGCYDVVTAGTGMWDGTGNIAVDVPGPVVDAFLWWAGTDWGGGGELDINGTAVTGTLIDSTPTLIKNPDWQLWRADVSTLVNQGGNNLAISGWENVDDEWSWRNGATLTVVYERDAACLDPVAIQLYEGLDWFWYYTAGQHSSETQVYSFEPAPFDRAVQVTLSYAGADQAAPDCRPASIWSTTGTGIAPTQLIDGNDYPNTTGINGAELLAADIFARIPPCALELGDAAVAADGGYIGGEWSVATIWTVLPAGAEWIAFQMDSDHYRDAVEVEGESGSWVGSVLQFPLPTPDVTVSKDDGQTNVEPGDTLVYDISYANIGDRYANDVVIEDTMPAGTSFVSCFTPIGTCSEAGGVVTFDLGTVDAGDSGVVQVTVELDAIFPCGETQITNNVTISTSTPGDDPSNNADDDTDIVTAYVTVDIEKSASPEPVAPGGTLSYTLDWTVEGNCAAEDTIITDVVPALTTFVSCEPAADCSESGGVVTWDLGTVTPPDSGSVTLETLVDDCLPDEQTIDNTAVISEAGGENDEDTVTSTVDADHELFIDKTGDPKPVMKNDPLTYTILWEITGNEPANDVIITDLVPDGTTFDSATNGGVLDPATGIVTWDLGDFCPPANGEVSFTVIVDRDLVDPAEISNIATISDPDPGTDPAEDRDITDVIPTSEIGDYVWFDENGDGVQDVGETGIPGVVVRLYDAGPDGLCGTADDTLLDTRTTDANGYYLFDLLLAGDYCVDVDDTTLPPDYYLSPSLTDPHGPITLDPEADPDEQYLDADFGYYPGGTIGDYVWLDENGDAVQDAGEAGIPGVVVNLYQAGPDGLCGTADDIMVTSTTTDADGGYLFDELPTGIYCVDVDESTLPDDVLLSPGQAEPHGPIDLSPGEDYLDADFGYYPAGTIGDYVWLDADRDGEQDAGEVGIPGVVVNLYQAGPDGLCGTADDVLVTTTTTDSDGGYLFDGLIMGDYCVDVDESTVPDDLNLTVGGQDPYGPIDLGPGEDYLDADFGYAYPELAISKTVDLAYLHRFEDLTFTIVVVNNGPGPADDVVVTDEISEYLEYIRINASQGTAVWNSGTRTVTANLGTLDEGEEATITITARATDVPLEDLPLTITNIATVGYGGGNDPDTPKDSEETTTELVYFTPGEIPEPGTLFMMGSGLLSMAGYAQMRLRRRRRRQE